MGKGVLLCVVGSVGVANAYILAGHIAFRGGGNLRCVDCGRIPHGLLL